MYYINHQQPITRSYPMFTPHIPLVSSNHFIYCFAPVSLTFSVRALLRSHSKFSICAQMPFSLFNSKCFFPLYHDSNCHFMVLPLFTTYQPNNMHPFLHVIILLHLLISHHLPCRQAIHISKTHSKSFSIILLSFLCCDRLRSYFLNL